MNVSVLLELNGHFSLLERPSALEPNLHLNSLKLYAHLSLLEHLSYRTLVNILFYRNSMNIGTQ
jgi:hypothetical protein